MSHKIEVESGNPYRDDEGQFASANGEGSQQKEPSLNKDKPIASNETFSVVSILPKDKNFYRDLTDPKERDKVRLVEKKYNDRFGEKLKKINEKAKNNDTINIFNTSSERRMKDKKIVDDYLDKQVRENNIPADRECNIVLGLPGAGKSFLSAKNKKSLQVDSDIFKNMIDEFKNDEEMVSAVHKESIQMADYFQKKAIEKGLNLTIGKVGGWTKQIKDICDSLIKNGYKIKISAVLVSQNTAVDRAINRYERGETSRVVPFDVFNSGNGIIKTLNEAINNGWSSEVEIYNNDVPMGQEPILLNKGKRNNSIKHRKYRQSLEEDKAKELFNI